MQGLPQGDADQKDGEHEKRARAPADQLPAALVTAALVAFDRGQGHGL